MSEPRRTVNIAYCIDPVDVGLIEFVHDNKRTVCLYAKLFESKPLDIPLHADRDERKFRLQLFLPLFVADGNCHLIAG